MSGSCTPLPIEFTARTHFRPRSETFAPYSGRMFRRLRKLTAIGPYRDSVVQNEESMRLAEELARRFEEQQRAA